MLIERKIDVLCISETWLSPQTPDTLITIPNYKIHRHDNGRGSGVCIYAKDTLNPTLIDTTPGKHPGIEDVWIQIQCRKLPSLIIGCMYRHPKAPHTSFDHISDLLKSISLHKKSIFLLGDLNDNLLSTNSKIPQITKNNKMHQLIDKPTRITQSSATLLDVIITNNPTLVINTDVIPSAIADHDLITLTVNISKPKHTPVLKTVRDLQEYTPDTLCSLLSNNIGTLNTILHTDDVNVQTNTLTSVMTKCLDICAPITTKVIRRPPAPWLNEETLQAIQQKNDILKQLKQNRTNTSLQTNCKHLKKKVKHLINQAKHKYYHNQLSNSKNNPSSTWKIIKDIIPDKKNNPSTHTFSDEKAKAEEFNEFFANVGKNTFNKTQINPPTHNYHPHPLPHSDLGISESVSNDSPSFRPQPIHPDTLILTIKHLNNTKSFGSDYISLNFIKDSLPIITFYLTTIINTSINTGIFPAAWKHAVVTPLHKKGDMENTSNYRPISLLPIFSKILEKIIANQLTLFLENNHLLTDNQHGFRPKLSTTTALTTINNIIYQNMDDKKITLLTLCDLSKAFDSVNHTILLEKLSKVWVDHFWFTNYLTDRTQSVRLNNFTSSKLTTCFGVPQGSILGPILFNIYVNDLTNHINNNCITIQYADDTQILHSGSLGELNNIIQHTEVSLSNIRAYFMKNGLLLNTDKTQCIFIGSRQILAQLPNNISIQFHDTKIHPTAKVKNLGIYMDQYMTYETHINDLHKKIMGALLYINKIKHFLDKETRILAIKSLALTHLNYCNIIWGTTASTLITKAQKLQNFAAKVADGKARKFDHVTPIMKELEWLDINNTITYNIATTVFKKLNNLYPTHFLPLPTVNTVTNSTSRQGSNLYVPRYKTLTGSRSLHITGPNIWNQLPNEITNTTSINVFKNKLRNHLLSKQYTPCTT